MSVGMGFARNQPKVKCADCGFLTARNKGDLVEVGDSYRTEGTIISVYDSESDGMVPAHAPIPMCFAREYTLAAELPSTVSFVDPRDKDTAKEALRAALRTTRMCASFIEWEQGFTPKEHAQEAKAKKLEQLKAKFNFITLFAILGISIILTTVIVPVSTALGQSLGQSLSEWLAK